MDTPKTTNKSPSQEEILNVPQEPTTPPANVPPVAQPLKKRYVGSNLILGIGYVVCLLGACAAAIYYLPTNQKLGFTWLAVAVIASQILIDVGQFSTQESKAKFTASFRLLSVVMLVAAAYLT